jgi:hypothetical protein
MNEGTALCIGRHVTCRGILEAFNDRRLAATIVSHNDSQGCVELDHMNLFIVKGSYASKGHLIEAGHRLQSCARLEGQGDPMLSECWLRSKGARKCRASPKIDSLKKCTGPRGV